MKKIVNLLGYEGLKIIIDPSILNFSTDATLLSDFVQIRKNEKMIIDLGSGTGYIPLFLSLKTSAHIYGIEIQKDIYDIFLQSIEINNLSHQIKPIHYDIKNLNEIFTPSSFDVVVSNPPYFKNNNRVSENEYKMIAKHEIKITFDELAKVVSYLLKDGGRFYFVHLPSRLFELVKILQKNNLEPVKIRYVYSKTNSEEAQFILVETRKTAKTGQLKILKPMYVLNEDGTPTDEMNKIYHQGENNEKTKNEF